MLLDLADRQVAVVPAGGGQDRVRPAIRERVREMR